MHCTASGVLLGLAVVWGVKCYNSQAPIGPEISANEARTLVKSGDLVLFRTYHGNVFAGLYGYFSHVGVVVVMDGEPYILEGSGMSWNTLKPFHHDGIWLTKFFPRSIKYKGAVFVKRLNQPLSLQQEASLVEFARSAKKQVRFDGSPGYMVRRMLGKRPNIVEGANCSDLVLYALIRAGLMEERRCRDYRVNYVRFFAYMTETDHPHFSYEPIPTRVQSDELDCVV